MHQVARLVTAILPVCLLFPLGSAAGAGTPRPGAMSIGDPYYPSLGNGGYDAQHYTLDLQIDVRHNRIAGTVTMAAVATQYLSRLSLDFVGFHISSIIVDGTRTSYSRQSRKVTITLPHPVHAAQRFTLVTRYAGTPSVIATPSGDGGWHRYPSGTYVVSEPDGAEGWFPVNDHPLDKATYTFRITVPRPYMAVANGLLQQVTTAGANTTFTWQERSPMASYLAEVATGRFTLQQSAGPHGLPLRSYYATILAGQAERAFARLPEMIAYFERILGPFPFAAYGTILIDGNLPYALETQTRSFFGIAVLTYIPDRAQEGISHELAHQWFGDSVSLKSWQDIWLNEGFATYLSWLWLEHIKARDYLSYVMRSQYGYLLEAAPFDTLLTHPALRGRPVLQLMETILRVQDHPMSEATILGDMGVPAVDQLTAQRALGFLGNTRPGSADARAFHEMALSSAPAMPSRGDLFPPSVYNRGAMTLQALRLRVGDATFFRILRTYYTRYRDGNAGTADFIGVASAVSHQNLAAFFHAWLYAPAAPPMPPLLRTQ